MNLEKQLTLNMISVKKYVLADFIIAFREAGILKLMFFEVLTKFMILWDRCLV